MMVNIVEILDLYLKNGGRRPYIIIVLNSCFIPKTFRTFPGFFPIFHRCNKNQDFFRTGNGFYEIPDIFPFSRLRGNPGTNTTFFPQPPTTFLTGFSRGERRIYQKEVVLHSNASKYSSKSLENKTKKVLQNG